MQPERQGRMGAQVRRELEAKQETQGPLVSWAKQVQLVAQERREGLAQLAKEEQMALQGKLAPGSYWHDRCYWSYWIHRCNRCCRCRTNWHDRCER